MRKIKCEYCDKDAVYDTDRIYLCRSSNCHNEFVINESSYSEEGFEDFD